MKEDAKNSGDLGWLVLHNGINVSIWQSAYDILFIFHRKKCV